MLRQLVTHVPDLVVNRLMDSKMEPPIMEDTHGVLVFADVSGIIIYVAHYLATNCVCARAMCVRVCVAICINM